MLKRLAGPFRNYFNSRFSAVHNSIVRGQEDDRLLLDQALRGIDELRSGARVLSDAVGNTDDNLQQTLVMIGRSIDELNQRVDSLVDSGTSGDPGVRAMAERLDQVARTLDLVGFDRDRQGALARLSAYDASIADFAYAHDGWAAQAGLWFNPPLSVAHAAGGVSLSQVNERIAEIPFVFGQLAGLRPGSRILDVGSTESTVALSLASLGHQVTALDPRPYPLSHPNLTSFQGPISEFSADDPFDAVVLLSSIEHFGVGAYDLEVDAEADVAAMDRIRAVSRPGTKLVLTTPYGDAPTTQLERTYTPDRLARLLTGWTVDEQSYLVRESTTVWSWRPEINRLGNNLVVLVSAHRDEDRP